MEIDDSKQNIVNGSSVFVKCVKREKIDKERKRICRCYVDVDLRQLSSYVKKKTQRIQL